MSAKGTTEKIEELLKIIGGIDRIEWGGGEVIGKTEEGKDIINMPYVIYPDGLYEKLYELMDAIGPDYDYPEHMEGSPDGADFEHLSEDKARTLLTCIVRTERFCEGNVAAAIENGSLTRLLKRIKELYSEK